MTPAFWFDEWKAYAGLFDGHSSSTLPGAIDNGPLVVDIDAETPELKERLLDGTDYELIPAPGYDQLVAWYGGGPRITRHVIALGVSSQLVCEVYPLKLRLVLAPDLATDAVVLHLSKLATIADLRAAIIDALDLDVDNDHVLHCHNFFGDVAAEDLLDPASSDLAESHTLDRACLVHGQKLLISLVPVDGGVASASDSDSIVALVSDSDSDSGADGWNMFPPTTSQWSYSPGGVARRARPLGTAGVERIGAVPGVCGLSNLGNTCFMNSGLQCITHAPQLVEYLLADKHVPEINRDNPLGMSGEVADEFVALLKLMWSGNYASVAPRSFKYTIGRFAPRFVGFGQQDSQELIAFLLDGLHEDLNRILDKPLVPVVEAAGRPDDVVASEAWTGHLRRNDSVIVDLFQGQLKSRVVCPMPDCGKVSVTFDPFMYLSVPVPDGGPRQLTVRVVLADPTAKHVIAKIFAAPGDTVATLKSKVASLVSSDPHRLILVEIYDHKLYKTFDSDYEALADILDEDVLVAYEIPKALATLPPYNPALAQPTFPAPTDATAPPDEAPAASDSDSDSSNTAALKANADAANLPPTTGSALPLSDPRCPYMAFPISHTKLEFRAPRSAFYRASRKPVLTQVAFGVPSLVFLAKPVANQAAVEEALLDSLARYVSRPTDDDLAAAGLVGDSEERAARKAERKAARRAAAKAARTKRRAAHRVKKIQVAERTKKKNAAKAAVREVVAAARAAARGAGVDALDSSDTDDSDLDTPSISGSTLSSLSDTLSTSGSTEIDSSDSSDSDVDWATLGVPEETPTKLVHLGPDGRGPSVDSYIRGRVSAAAETTFVATWNAKLLDACYDTAGADACRAVTELPPKADDEAPNVLSCLRKFTKEEQLGEEDLWYCPDCETFRQATKKFDLYSLPDVLVIHLKRFRQSRYSREKIDVLIDFPLEGLDLGEFLPESAAEQVAGATVYDLFAVSDHFGGLGGGHYTAHAKNHQTGRWHYFNDSSTSVVVGDDDVVSAAAYLLFYQRRGAELHVPNKPPVRPPPASDDGASSASSDRTRGEPEALDDDPTASGAEPFDLDGSDAAFYRV
ncbi:ubiquitin carboxyl-terminal hydrolase [Thecamonas trahens ATCC 50062]|uniref:ubiquitinyl hydrolase 1 n=1 Tax=Thecamonas trahens ATCC 50062 TaxID=461836 RepID=A0A0L0DPP2_THETB|nr:ubiquitin carboxyl-terminal hydrolase [Thecamonas trahens ATCC 50062]KNC54267.1 ubiquitin carboxyl-terminal hydrolase [Thecamonas trahens ATCC 50062]|eukprot:XP_013753899.1 ubiquitin carboxyl-terminal hydrolase [Thecamonas trahens ATCC 50062]